MILSSLLQLLPILHGADGLPTGPLWSDWQVDPTVVLGVFALIAGYLAWTGPLNRRPGVEERPVSRGQRVAFLAGSVALLIALAPPVDDWADNYLISAHMVQHVVLVMVVPPLWLLGTPVWLLRSLLRNPLVARLGVALTRPMVAFALSSAILVLWHVPVLYDAALRHEPLHILQHLCFLATAVLVWWALIGPLPEWPRLSAPVQCLYLFLLTVPGGMIGAVITNADPGLYEAYAGAPRLWGLSVGTDQQVAGLTMWVGTNLVYLALITGIFFRWAAREEAKEKAIGYRLSAIGRQSAGDGNREEDAAAAKPGNDLYTEPRTWPSA